MGTFTEHLPGTFCWVDLGTTNAEGAKKFYSELMGWKAVDTPAGPDMVYSMLQLGDKNAAAVYEMSQKQISKGMPSHWLSYVLTSDADETAEKVTALGGSLIMEPFDVFDAGRTFAFQDPTGAHLAVWHPNQHIGAQIKGEAGSFCWNELMTNDVTKAADFYLQLFGWTLQTRDMPDGNQYHMFSLGDIPAGGMMEIQKEWGEVPPNWLVYFTVANCDESLEKVTSLGGKVEVPAMDAPDVGRFGVISDPQGAVSGIITLANPE